MLNDFISSVGDAITSMFKRSPKRWSNRYRVVEVVYNNGEIKYFVHEKMGCVDGEYWSTISEGYYYPASAIDKADLLYSQLVKSDQVILK